jgi:hypothetical protein
MMDKNTEVKWNPRSKLRGILLRRIKEVKWLKVMALYEIGLLSSNEKAKERLVVY